MKDVPREGAAPHNRALVAIKLLHSAAWFFFVSCIVALPIAGWYRRFDLALILTGCVLFECAVLGLNRGKCPLTVIAARFTADRSAAFDIYLPQWLAARNKVIFGALFVINGLVVLGQWLLASHRLLVK
jgi:hypothetical protein